MLSFCNHKLRVATFSIFKLVCHCGPLTYQYQGHSVTKLTHFPPIIAQNSWFLLPKVKAMCGRERFADFSKS
jgi:hypothetical protein